MALRMSSKALDALLLESPGRLCAMRSNSITHHLVYTQPACESQGLTAYLKRKYGNDPDCIFDFSEDIRPIFPDPSQCENVEACDRSWRRDDTTPDAAETSLEASFPATGSKDPAKEPASVPSAGRMSLLDGIEVFETNVVQRRRGKKRKSDEGLDTANNKKLRIVQDQGI